MQRTIKFRAWSKPTRKEKGEMFRVIMLTFKEDGSIIASGRGGSDTDVILMQYTGLKDKNDKEIYEGDIVKLPNPEFVMVVEFGEYNNNQGCDDQEDGNGWYLRHRYRLSHTGNSFASDEAEQVEVIGNCFENPELLN